MEEKVKMEMSGYEDSKIAELIYAVAQYQARCKGVGSTSDMLKVTAEDIREAADLVFLSLSLIEEWRSKR